ncbi:hypothetical protein BJY52DRAFT_1183000 [Lactarius psammicola]|nr:hypothetical protein BJY52DRAFT_1183000 [Lactarius psammicola]
MPCDHEAQFTHPPRVPLARHDVPPPPGWPTRSSCSAEEPPLPLPLLSTPSPSSYFPGPSFPGAPAGSTSRSSSTRELSASTHSPAANRRDSPRLRPRAGAVPPAATPPGLRLPTLDVAEDSLRALNRICNSLVSNTARHDGPWPG